MTTIVKAWGTIRSVLGECRFNDIKDLVGLAGIDLYKLSHLDQNPENGATKGQLLTAIDALFGRMNPKEGQAFLTILVEELLKKNPALLSQLGELLSRHGWGVVDSRLVALELFDPVELAQLPEATRSDLVKASQRFRDGDLSGAISAACGAIDTATSEIYAAHSLGDPTKASFQQRCTRSLEALRTLADMEDQLRELGWNEAKLKQFLQNFNGALNQGANVLQTLRSDMGDVHGSKPILKPLVYDALKWADLFVRRLSTNRS
ncbi:hypothetical protein [Pseudomonas sp. B6001]|uniref:hypothetical protein n=1 Tax=Pseudomonas sp. B6001 TaxID=2738813 RepID=UPI0015A4ABDD|nr:hypothetical protein [Pseudomonas sp. B6001]NVZ96758.1 hypothetical protein [Pseudomonas sp. B6001]